ncbi:OmpH family outer membrane protein [Sphingobacterium bovistauri]|uniref:OmpH family outer membrane protein n=1 Tax=Sphingobacterium bovistauri TaxID=2781959 RepID=A0ABS7Z956_9SPHI|nr:OmpH family outer membrane protein [Sphingobacterium bovistauri]MCA5006543.1 OmpH family outer membrane protein [Sphingobacterium bovistauri]
MKNLLKGAVIVMGLFAATSVANAQQKIGHINADEIFQQTAEFKTATATLKTLGETKQKEIEGMVSELQKKEKEANDLMLNQSEANKAETQTKLQTIGQEYQQMQARVQEVQKVAQEEVAKKQQELMAPIQTKVMNAINVVAKEKGYAYIFDTGSGAAVYYGGGDDVSADVKTKLGIK